MSSTRRPTRVALVGLTCLAILLAAVYMPALGGAPPADGLFDDLDGADGDSVEDGPRSDDNTTDDDRLSLPFGLPTSWLPDLEGGELTDVPDDEIANGPPNGGDVVGDDGSGDDIDGDSLDTEAGIAAIQQLLELFARGGSPDESDIDVSEDDLPENVSEDDLPEDLPLGEAFGEDCHVTDTDLIVCFETDVVAGQTVNIGVYGDDGPVNDATVTFDGEPVGETNDDGQLTATVPYTRELAVGVQPPERQAVGSANAFGTGVQPAPVSAPVASEEPIRTPVSGNLTITRESETLEPGEAGEFAVEIGDQPVAGAEVSIDGEPVGTTDEDGRLTATLPVARTITVDAVRDEFDASERFVLADLSVAVDGNGPFGVVLPGDAATVTVMDGNETVSDATVSLEGTTIGSTDENGTVTTSLPVAWGVDATATTSAGLTQETTAYPYAPLVVFGFGATGALVGVAALYRRSNASGRTGLAIVRDGTRTLSERMSSSLVGLAARLEGGGRTGIRRARTLPSTLRTAPATVFRRVMAWLRRLRSRIDGGVGDRIDRSGKRRSHTGTNDAEAGTDSHVQVQRTPAPNDVEAAWHRFLETMALRAVRSKTPGQIAARAVEAGHPREPVVTLTDAFRAVSYSSDDPDAHADAAMAAANEIVDAADEDEGSSVNEGNVDGPNPDDGNHEEGTNGERSEGGPTSEDGSTGSTDRSGGSDSGVSSR